MNPVVGTWVRNQGSVSFFWTFNGNNTYETDEIPGHTIARGRYDYDPRGQVYVYLDGDINAFGVDVSGNNLTVTFESGNKLHYTRGDRQATAVTAASTDKTRPPFHFAFFLLSLGAFGIFALWVLISSIQGMVGFDSFMSVVVSIIAIVLALVLVGGVGVIYGRINFLLYKAASSSDSIVIRFFCALLFIVILVAAGIFGTLSTPDEAAWLSVVVWTHVISGILSAFFGMTFPNKSK